MHAKPTGSDMQPWDSQRWTMHLTHVQATRASNKDLQMQTQYVISFQRANKWMVWGDGSGLEAQDAP